MAPQEAGGRSDLLDSAVRRDLVETLAALPADPDPAYLLEGRIWLPPG